MVGNKKVTIVMGSDSDMPVMEAAGKLFDEFGVEYNYLISSAHRTPDKTAEFARNAEANGIKAIIAGAGFAAHLAGVIAAHTTLPVIGVPINSSSLDGLDSLLAMVQMPSGIPVATVTIGKAGAKNAAILAVQMLALSDEGLANKLKDYRKKMADAVEEKNKSLK